MNFESSKSFANELDENDVLGSLKEKFNFPISNPIYLCGHSLGLQPNQQRNLFRLSLMPGLSWELMVI